MTAEFVGPATRLAPGDIEAVAAELRVDPAVVHAVCEVEAAGSGFLPDGRPKILYEAHVFYRQTGGQFGISNVSSPRWDRSLYGAQGAHQYERLAAAIELDRAAALKSASWGMFQILGQNHAACGFADVESFVLAMTTGERAHLDAFAAFCRHNGLDRHLRAEPPDYVAFARGYNGPGFRANAYDTKLETADRKWRAAMQARSAAPVAEIEQAIAALESAAVPLQVLLQKHGFYRGDIDGDWGPRSRTALLAYREMSRRA